jgi:hypothetical protein
MVAGAAQRTTASNTTITCFINLPFEGTPLIGP